MQENQKSWNKAIPWFLSIASFLVLAYMGYFLVQNIEWYKQSVFNNNIKSINTPEYRFYAYHLHLSMIKRSVGLFSGFAVMFLGLGVSFYTLQNNSKLFVEGKGLSAKLVTSSPGIIAVVIGATIIIYSISSKDHFPSYSNISNSFIDNPEQDVNYSIFPSKK